MDGIHIVDDLDECREIWCQVIPGEVLTDLWEIRAVFQDCFDRPVRFIVEEDRSGITGLLPLSWIEEVGCFGYFPGETWEKKTWLEQNRIIARREATLDSLLSSIPGPYHIRYLSPACDIAGERWSPDETGYLFKPPLFRFDMANYFGEFSSKTIKRLKKKIGAFEAKGVSYRYGRVEDFDLLVDMNVSRFGSSSYFHDQRFLKAFRGLVLLLADRGWLRVTTVLVGGEPAAVDVGSLYRGVYTLLAGGTNRDFQGIAKVINLHHMEQACLENIDEVDFLCGDFNWKILFHLQPRPLYLLADVGTMAA